MPSIKPCVYGADFETDNDTKSAWIVQWCIHDRTNFFTGTTLDGFKIKVLELFNNNIKTIIYFHNLKFDLEHFKYILKDFEQLKGVTYDYKVRNGNPNSIHFEFKDSKGRTHKLEFRDSLKKLRGTLKEVGNIIGVSKLDSPVKFYSGWSSSIDMNDPSNWNYIRRDAEIVAIAMNRMHAEGRIKATTASDAIFNAKKIIEREYDKYYWEKKLPVLGKFLEDFLRPGYRGGLNISAHKGYNEGPIIHADVNSMYPAVLKYDMLPIGMPKYSLTRPVDKMYVVCGCYKLKLKPEARGLAWFVFKNSMEAFGDNILPGIPVVETQSYHKLTLTSIDFELLNFWYDVEIDPNIQEEFYVFNEGSIGFFSKFVDDQMQKKISCEVSGDSLGRQSAKDLMNSLYGRLGMSREMSTVQLLFSSKYNDYRFDETLIDVDHQDTYLPMAMFTTAHARRRLLDYCWKAGPENVIHCDTDSVIHLAPNGKVKGVNYHDEELGAWKVEAEPIWMYEGGAKRYIECLADKKAKKTVNGLKMACCGLQQNKNEMTGKPEGCWIEVLDDPALICKTGAVIGHEKYTVKSDWLKDLLGTDCVNTMKLQQSRVPGGCILKETTFTIEENKFVFGRGTK